MTQGSDPSKRTSISQLRSYVRSIPYLMIFAGAVLAILAIWPYIYYSKAERDLLHGVKSRIENGLTSFPVGDVTNFDWETVCFFYGMSSSPIHESLHERGIQIPSKHNEVIDKAQSTSDTRLYVFSRDSSVVETIYVPFSYQRISGDPYDLIGVECVSSDSAIFEIGQKGQRKTLSLSTKENENGG